MNINLMRSLLVAQILIISNVFTSHAQHWKFMTWDDSLSFRAVEDAFMRDRYAGLISDSAKDIKEFKRFEYFWRPRVNSDDSGKRGKLNNYVRELRDFYDNGPVCADNLNPAPWTSLGPFTTNPVGVTGVHLAGQHQMGIIVSLWAQQGVSPVTEVLAGTNSSGLWRGSASSGNGAWQWECLTESLRLPGMGVSTIAVDENGTIYIGTSMGYRNGGGYSAGVWRSNDNGNSWVNLADIGPDTNQNSVWSIKIFGGNLYVVMDRTVLRAPTTSDLSLPGVFADITPNPGQGNHGRYNDIDEFRESSTSAVLVLTSESKGGRGGGGLVHTSTDGGNTWADVTTQFSTMNQTFVVNMLESSAFISYNNSDPNSWHVNNPTNLQFLPSTENATAQVAYHQPLPYPSYGLVHQGTYDLVMNFTKDANAILRVYTQDGGAQDPVVPGVLLHEFGAGIDGSVSVPVEVVGYPRRLVFVAEYAGAAVNGIQINNVALQTDDMERFRVSAVNDLSSAHAGIYVASLPPSVSGPWPTNALKVHRISDVGQPFALLHAFPNSQVIAPGLFGENGGEFEISSNGNIYFGGSNNNHTTASIKVFRAAENYNSNIGSEFCHADTRALYIVEDAIESSETILKGDDGGVSIAYNGGSTMLTMISLNGTYFPITQFYGMGIDEREQFLYAGAQDNGSWLYDVAVGAWTNPDGGDGGESRVLSSNDGTYSARLRVRNGMVTLFLYGQTPCSSKSRQESGSNWRLGNPVEIYDVKSEYKARAYLSHKKLWKLDCAVNTSQNMMLSLPGYSNFVWGIGIHEDDDNLIFVGGSEVSWDPNIDRPHGLMRTRDNGATWIDITSELRNLTTGTGPQPMAYFGISDVLVDPSIPADQPATVYVSFDGFAHDQTRRVYKSVDDGQTWTDISNGLPIFPVNDLELQKGSGGILYAATDAGVYVYDPQLGHWSCFSEALPICIATEVKANTCTGKLYASTFGRGIWATDLYQPQTTSVRSISINTTISGIELGRSSIVIEPGAALTITGELRMYRGSKIIVKQNAILVVDGGKITAQCGDFWPGIEVWGTTNQHQFPSSNPTHQGLLVLKNGAIIEHAREAFTGWKPGDWNTIGGVIQVQGIPGQIGGTFLNSRRAAGFLAYQNFHPGQPNIPRPNNSYFNYAHFKVDDNYRGGTDFHDHVSMWKVDGIQFRACVFENAQTSVPTSTQLGRGIYSIDADYIVTGNCTALLPVGVPCPAQSLDYGAFIGLGHGIDARGGGSGRGFTVRDCRFQNNVVGVYTEGLSTFSVVRNDFTLGDRDVALNGVVDGNFQLPRHHRGVSTQRSYGFRIEENRFARAANTTAEGVSAIVIENSRENNTQAYKNDAFNMDEGYIGEGRCMDFMQASSIGHQFICNTNNGNEQNFWARRDNGVASPNLHSIRTQQGSDPSPAGNTFDQDQGVPLESDYKNETAWVINCWYSAGQSEPMDITPGWLGKTLATGTNGCPSRLSGREVRVTPGLQEQVGNELQAAKTAYINTAYVFNNLLDGGNTDAVVEEVQESWPNEAWQLRQYLLSKSPYLSTEVLKEMMVKNTLPQAMVLEICLANPEATKKEGFTRWAEYEAPAPLPSYMIDLIAGSWAPKTFRMQLEAQMGQHHADMSVAADILQDALRSDDDAIYPAEALAVWQQLPNYGARYGEIAARLRMNDFDGARIVLNNLQNAYPMKEDREAERDRTLWYIDQLAALITSGRHEPELNEAEIAQWQAFALEASDIPGTWAGNVLCFFHDVCIGRGDGPSIGNKSLRPTVATDERIEPVAALSLLPNPASAWVTVAYELTGKVENAVVRMLDARGREVATFTLSNAQGQHVWDTRQVPAGVYSVELLNNGLRVETKRLVVQPQN